MANKRHPKAQRVTIVTTHPSGGGTGTVRQIVKDVIFVTLDTGVIIACTQAEVQAL